MLKPLIHELRRCLGERATGSLSLGTTHFLVDTSRSTQRRIHLLSLETTPAGDQVLGIVGKLWASWDDTCEAFRAAHIAADDGYERALLDAALEILSPDGLVGKGSDFVAKTFRNRNDVQVAPAACATSAQVYRKRPGALAGKVMTVAELNRNPNIAKWVGTDVAVKNVDTDLWDFTRVLI